MESVELAELVARGGGGAGHTAGDVVAADELLDGHGVQDAASLRDLQALLGLYRRLQTVRPTLKFRHASLRGVDELYLAVAHDVVDIALQQLVGVQCNVDLNQGGADVFGVVQRADAKQTFDACGAGVGEEDVAATFVDGVVVAELQATHHVGNLPGRCGARLIAGEHKRD